MLQLSTLQKEDRGPARKIIELFSGKNKVSLEQFNLSVMMTSFSHRSIVLLHRKVKIANISLGKFQDRRKLRTEVKEDEKKDKMISAFTRLANINKYIYLENYWGHK